MLDKLKPRHPTALFLYVDCRLSGTSRKVFQRVAEATVDELERLLAAKTEIRPELVDAAHVVSVLASFDDVELKKVHEHLIQFKAAAGLAADAALLKYLKANLSISLERSERQTAQLTGAVRIDERKLHSALTALFEDIRREGIGVILLIDNLDELHHYYREEAQRQTAREHAMWVMELRKAPVAFLACMRSYFADVARDIGDKIHLEPLPANILLAIVERRCRDEPASVQQLAASPEVKSLMNMLAGVASTPLAYLDWLKFFVKEKAFDPQRRRRVIEKFSKAEFANLAFDVLEQLGRSFEKPERELDRGELLKACGDRESELVAVIDAQAVLPNNFWTPTRYRLDPLLNLLLPGVHSKLT